MHLEQLKKNSFKRTLLLHTINLNILLSNATFLVNDLNDLGVWRLPWETAQGKKSYAYGTNYNCFDLMELFSDRDAVGLAG